MPAFHHAVPGALTGDGQPMQLPRQPDGEVADIDHLLHLALGLGQRLAALDGDEAGKIVLVLAKRIAEQAHQFTSPWCGDDAPDEESGL